MKGLCSKSVHGVPAYTLVQDDRVLLKNLRVLTVSAPVRPSADNSAKVTIRYHEVCSDERGALDVPKRQQVKIICGGRCSISRELEDLI